MKKLFANIFCGLGIHWWANVLDLHPEIFNCVFLEEKNCSDSELDHFCDCLGKVECRTCHKKPAVEWWYIPFAETQIKFRRLIGF
jgi:hypothetical protein